jgi:hypothetical protein
LALHLGELLAKVVLNRLSPLSPLRRAEDLFDRNGNNRRTVVGGTGDDEDPLAGIARYCFRAASQWVRVVVGADGLMLTVVVDDDDIRCGAVSDGWASTAFGVEEILTLHNLLPFSGWRAIQRLAKVADTR